MVPRCRPLSIMPITLQRHLDLNPLIPLHLILLTLIRFYTRRLVLSSRLLRRKWMTIRSRLAPTTCSYRYSHILTRDRSSNRVSRSEGEGEERVRGFGYFNFGRLLDVYNYSLSYTCGNPSQYRHPSLRVARLGLCQVKNCVFQSIIDYW